MSGERRLYTEQEKRDISGNVKTILQQVRDNEELGKRKSNIVAATNIKSRGGGLTFNYLL